MSVPRVLVTGASGFVGRALIPRLQSEGYRLRAMTRSSGQLAVQTVQADAVSGEGLQKALADIDIAYYLIHSMESENRQSFAELELQAAKNFAAAATLAGVKRTIYLGGLLPSQEPFSAHLASRHAVEQHLLRELPDTVALRASIVIGSESRSFRLLVRLVERLPLLALPQWRNFQTQPIDVRDVVEILTQAATNTACGGSSIDIYGPDRLSYQQLLELLAERMLVQRPGLNLPFNLNRITAVFAATIAGEDPALIEPLMGSLNSNLLPRNDDFERIFDLKTHSLKRAIDHALLSWEQTQQLAAR